MAAQLKAGVVGIGAMGMGVAMSLLRAGFAARVRDIRPEAEAGARGAGAIVHRSAGALAADCDVVISLVVDDRQTEEVLFAADGLADAMSAGGVVMLSSTLPPDYVESAAARLAARGLRPVDAPVSGGPARAHAGTMSMMLAGADAALERAGPVLAAISGPRFRVGAAPGDGSRMKIVNNMLAGANLAAGCEAMALGMKLGLDPKQVFEVVQASSGASWIFGDRMARALEGDFVPRAAARVLTKDLSILLDAARDAGFEAPMARAAHAVFVDTLARGLAEADDAAVLKRYLEGAGLPPPERSR